MYSSKTNRLFFWEGLNVRTGGLRWCHIINKDDEEDEGEIDAVPWCTSDAAPRPKEREHEENNTNVAVVYDFGLSNKWNKRSSAYLRKLPNQLPHGSRAASTESEVDMRSER